MLRTETLRADAHRLSGRCWVLLDLLATVERTAQGQRIPAELCGPGHKAKASLTARWCSNSSSGFQDKWLGHIIPTRFALFGTIEQ